MVTEKRKIIYGQYQRGMIDRKSKEERAKTGVMEEGE